MSFVWSASAAALLCCCAAVLPEQQNGLILVRKFFQITSSQAVLVLDGSMMEASPTPGFWDRSNEELLENLFPVHRVCRDGDCAALSGMLANETYDLCTEDRFYGWTPAHWAAYYGQLECLKLLVSAGVNLDITSKAFHQTPTHVAAFGNQPDCIRWMTLSGASVNVEDYLGETPTHKAARSGAIQCLEILKAGGATFRIANKNGHTPKDLALSCDNKSCACYIERLEKDSLYLNGFKSNGFTSNGFTFNGFTSNGFTSSGFGRKRTTDAEVTPNEASQLKKARIEEEIPVAVNNTYPQSNGSHNPSCLQPLCAREESAPHLAEPAGMCLQDMDVDKMETATYDTGTRELGVGHRQMLTEDPPSRNQDVQHLNCQSDCHLFGPIGSQDSNTTTTPYTIPTHPKVTCYCMNQSKDEHADSDGKFVDDCSLRYCTCGTGSCTCGCGTIGTTQPPGSVSEHHASVQQACRYGRLYESIYRFC